MATQERIIDTVTSHPQRVRISPRSGTLTWALQRVTSYGLLIFLTVHLLLNYYVPILRGTPLTFEDYSQRFVAYPIIYAINEWGLLICALFHGLNGVRSVVYDMVTSPTVRRIITILLIVIGVYFLIDGSLTLLALMRMEP